MIRFIGLRHTWEDLSRGTGAPLVAKVFPIAPAARQVRERN
jgi:hypothetical protein